MKDKELLNNIWENFSFEEIISKGYETGKLSLYDILKEAESIEKESNKFKKHSDFLEDLKELFDTYPNSEHPWSNEIMSVITDYYSEYELMDYFDNDDMIDYLDNSLEMDSYIEEKCNESVNEYIETTPLFNKQDFIKQLQNCNNDIFKRFLCDVLDEGYHISPIKLIDKIMKKIK